MRLLAKRQRAMLREMGIRVWQPEPEPEPKPEPEPPVAAAAHAEKERSFDSATTSIAASALNISAKGTFDTYNKPVQAVQPLQSRQPIARPQAREIALTRPAISQIAPNADGWRAGTLQTLYGDSVMPKTSRWLLLLESPEAALRGDFNAFAGDAGKLLDNMLRAAKLHVTAEVMLTPLVRGQASGNNQSSQLTELLTELLSGLLVQATPDVMLVMGRLAGQAVLQSTEPLARLRGQVHGIQNIKTIVTLDPAYLLRNPLDKAKAWDDLCLAWSVVSD